MFTSGYVAPPTISTTGNVLSGNDWVGQPRIRTAPDPPPNFSTFRSFGGSYRRPFGLFGKGGRGYKYSSQYGGYGGYGGYGYPYSYSYYPYYYWNYPSYQYPREAPQQPAAPSELYTKPLSDADKKRYCENLYKPYCGVNPTARYCNRYSDLCFKKAVKKAD